MQPALHIRPFQSAFTWLAFLAIGLLLIGPFIDPYFAQRMPEHQHLGPSYAMRHSHVYDQIGTQTTAAATNPTTHKAALPAMAL